MNQCFICNSNTQDVLSYQSICHGCLSLIKHPEYDCLRCGVELQSDHGICGNCQTKPPMFSEVKYVGVYQFPIDNWVKNLKFGKNILMSTMFAELMQPLLNEIEPDYCLMPVPLHVSRLRSRGYNQAYEIVKEISKLSNRPIDTSLKRSINTKMQAQLKLNQRASNVSKAFLVQGDLDNKKIVLIDDVMTSGNTLKECAKTLKKAGALDIKIIIFARKSL
ncbi:MAG: ComF family protein [Marinicellaceae bacterium]